MKNWFNFDDLKKSLEIIKIILRHDIIAKTEIVLEIN